MLFRKLWRTMGLYKAQFISMIIMIALGIGVFVGFNMEWFSIEKNTSEFFADTGFADYRIMSEDGLSTDDLEKIKDISGVTDAARYVSVIDYQETLSGQRDEGTSYAFFSFTRKLGQALAGILGTSALDFIGYDAKNITAQTADKMYNIATVIPAATCLIMALSLGLFYNLSKAKLKELYANKTSK